jgi:hypothetical protein
MHRQAKLWRRALQSAQLMLLTMALTLPLLYLACQPRESELPFETIERRDTAGTGEIWEAREPGLMIMATSEDLVQIDSLFTRDVQAQLREVDFNACFAVTVFLGWQGSGHEGIDIERVVRRGDEVSVYVQVGGPRGTDEVTSPYHLVKVRKVGKLGPNVSFRAVYGRDRDHVAVPFHPLIQTNSLEVE